MRSRTDIVGVVVRAVGLAVALGGAAGAAAAHTVRMVDYVCPIDGEKFAAATTMSYTVFGQRLDGRPIGALPVPSLHPVCPSSGFMMYKIEFSAAEIAMARSLLASDVYRRLRSTETPHFLSAMVAEYLGELAELIAHLYQEAAWGTEGEGARHDRYLRVAIEKIEAFRATLPADDKRRIYAQVRVVELLRQVQDFDAAEQALTQLPADSNNSMPQLQAAVKQLRSRIVARDAMPL